MALLLPPPPPSNTLPLSEALIIMSKPRDHPEPNIPAVFVSEKAGVIMRRLMTPGLTRVRIVPVSDSSSTAKTVAGLYVCVGVACVHNSGYSGGGVTGWEVAQQLLAAAGKA